MASGIRKTSILDAGHIMANAAHFLKSIKLFGFKMIDCQTTNRSLRNTVIHVASSETRYGLLGVAGRMLQQALEGASAESQTGTQVLWALSVFANSWSLRRTCGQMDDARAQDFCRGTTVARPCMTAHDRAMSL